MKCSLCDQYWNKYDPFENIKESVLFTHYSIVKPFGSFLHDYNNV